MSNISNEDLLKLIHRVIQKQDTLEEKLDQVLVFLMGEWDPPKIRNKKDLGEPNHAFKFSPIKNEKELQLVSEKIEKDPKYRKDLRLFMQFKENLKLEHLFTEEFLYDCNLIGASGKIRLEELVPYEQVFAYIMRKDGYTKEQTKRAARMELYRVKSRLHKRRFYQNKRNLTTDDGNDENQTTEDNQVEFVDLPLPYKKELETHITDVEYSDESMDESAYTKEETTTTCEEPGQVLFEDEAENDEAPVEIYYQPNESADDFTPIKNDEDLEQVTRSIKTNPKFLKELRIKIVEESDDGQCTLQQLFAIEYLKKFNLTGNFGLRKLVDLVPYKAVYFYLKKHLGMSVKQIELDANNELKKIKSRLAGRRKYMRKKGELPPYVRPQKKQKTGN